MSAVTIRYPTDMWPPKAPAPANILLGGLPLGAWNHPKLEQEYASRMSEPTSPVDKEHALARYLLLKRNLESLEKMRAKVPGPRGQHFDMKIDARRFQRKIQTYKLIPLNDFPIEILSQIFGMAVEQSSDADKQRMTLTWVCRQWREVAIADLLLWRTLTFSGSPPWTTTFLAMERAAGAPLHVKIAEMPKPKGDVAKPPSLSKRHARFLMQRLLTKLPQIVTLSIILDDQDAITAAVQELSNTAKYGRPEELTSLWLHAVTIERRAVDDNGVPIPVRPQVLFDGSMPKMRKLFIDNTTCRWDTINCPNLTSLDLRRLGNRFAPKAPAFRNILQSSPNLHRLLVDCAGPFGPLGNYGPPIMLRHLTELVIGDYVERFSIFALEQFDAPNLKTLALLPMKDDPKLLVQWLLRNKRFRHIQDLALLGTHFSPTEETKAILVRWFDSMPQLRLLKAAQIGSDVFDALLEDPRLYRNPRPEISEDSPREVLCPQLWAMSLDLQPADVTAPFIKGREQIGIPFKRLFLSIRYEAALKEKDRQLYAAAYSGPWYLNGSWSGSISEEDHETALTF